MTSNESKTRFVLGEPELGKALNSCKSSFSFAGFFILFVNVLLTPSIYPLAV